MNSDFRTGRHVVYDLHAHIVLTTKYRKEVFTGRVEKVVIEKAKECCKRNESELLEAKSDKKPHTSSSVLSTKEIIIFINCCH